MGPAELPVAQPPRYASTAAGAFAGGLVAAALGLWLARALAGDDVADDAVAIVATTFVMLWVGMTGGAWLALRLLDDRLAGRTTFMVGAGALAWTVVSVPSLLWVLDSLPEARAGRMGAGLLVTAMLTVPPSLAARWIILANEKLPEREETLR